MSVVVSIAAAGAVTVAGPVLLAATAGAAAALGLKALSDAEVDARARAEVEAELQNTEEIHLSAGQTAALEEIVVERSTQWFGDERITLCVRRDIRGRLSVHAKGQATPQELHQRAEALLGRLRQQLAYRAVVKRLGAVGLQVASEEQLADGTARVRVRRS